MKSATPPSSVPSKKLPESDTPEVCWSALACVHALTLIVGLHAISFAILPQFIRLTLLPDYAITSWI